MITEKPTATDKNIADLRERLEGRTPEAMLTAIAHEFSGRTALATSFSLEDQVLTHIIVSTGLPIRIFTIDTGRLFPDTYRVLRKTNEQYQTRIEVFTPRHDAVQGLVSAKGPFSFYESVDNRLECCHIRKVEPLERALQDVDVWITGIRREHSASRESLPLIEWDSSHALFKIHPLIDWGMEQVRSFIEEYCIPYNSLFDRDYTSIGCEPCTRAVKPGEDMRVGRWWWESNSTKECGLHIHE
jgi:phosphoadenosine phosphosulfate reductase